MTAPRYPAKPRPGDLVAVLSPSSGLPGLLPLPYELGLRRLRDDFGLKPVEYPATRRMGSSPEERAADIHAAFADPGIKAVIASIGGDDQITVLPHLEMGERGLLEQFPAVLVGRAKSWSFEKRLDGEGKARFRREQREAVLRALRRYAPDAMVVFDVDFGHTDPQMVIPVGGRIRVDGPARRIVVTY